MRDVIRLVLALVVGLVCGYDIGYMRCEKLVKEQLQQRKPASEFEPPVVDMKDSQEIYHRVTPDLNKPKTDKQAKPDAGGEPSGPARVALQ